MSNESKKTISSTNQGNLGFSHLHYWQKEELAVRLEPGFHLMNSNAGCIHQTGNLFCQSGTIIALC